MNKVLWSFLLIFSTSHLQATLDLSPWVVLENKTNHLTTFFMSICCNVAGGITIKKEASNPQVFFKIINPEGKQTIEVSVAVIVQPGQAVELDPIFHSQDEPISPTIESLQIECKSFNKKFEFLIHEMSKRHFTIVQTSKENLGLIREKISLPTKLLHTCKYFISRLFSYENVDTKKEA